jgi:hypothetical protein
LLRYDAVLLTYPQADPAAKAGLGWAVGAVRDEQTFSVDGGWTHGRGISGGAMQMKPVRAAPCVCRVMMT